MCAEGPGEVNGLGDLRIFASAVCEAYLRRTEIVPGYVVAVWRGRHVAERTELTDMEAAEFDRSVRAAARALERHYRPARLNFLVSTQWGRRAGPTRPGDAAITSRWASTSSITRATPAFWPALMATSNEAGSVARRAGTSRRSASARS